ncbi:extradiol dioxygenase [Solitalea longa]|uniref:Extradiol dioxygenase n=1 Tax=Solitalea longa TaxID=2079460 RepID=A0A2S4ZWV9_9SPHI|nr:VOC family protein [Solitalea longa]POY34776.1 extradiol dioxygenase [Solitalea longa]
MTNQFWINLPVKDVDKSRAFFTQIGFRLNTQHGNGNDSASLLIGDQNVIIMLFQEQTFSIFSSNSVTDTKQSTEVLFSIDAQSPTEVDEIALKAERAGGVVFGKPSLVQGWMYGCGFTDLDGHRWNVLHMDMTKMPKG